jgi:hypothetical protein
MAQRKHKTPRTKSKPQSSHQPAEHALLPLGLTLPPEVNRRLAILIEDHDLETVLSEAVRLLWDRRYPRQPGLKPATLAADASTPHAPEAAKENAASEAAEPESKPPAAKATKVQSSAKQPSPTAASEQESAAATPATDRQVIAERIQTLHGDGLSFTAIAARLNQENIPTVSGSGKWHHGAVKRLLRTSLMSSVNP